MMEPGLDLLQRTMQGLESGLHVEHIATFGLVTCDRNEPPAEVYDDPERASYDFIPVRDEGRVVAVLERPNLTPRPLDDTMLVSGQTPLTWFVRHALESPYRLVIRHGNIEGIVTRSDLQKLPVRLLVFTLITHLEMTMADLIRRALDEDAWVQLLSENRRHKLREKQQSLLRGRMDLPLIELTEFCDKRDIIKKHFKQGKRFEKELKAIENLRNTIAHAGSFASTPKEVKDFVNTYNLMEQWIAKLNDL